jgi:anaerobic selenocysteine-containing dehydrogenase
VTRTACPLDCPDACTLEVTVEGGRITAIDAGPGNPLTDGYICQKVKHHARRVYGPDRVLQPLMRTGPKGTGTFAPISWDDALDLFVDRLRAAAAGPNGPASVVPYLYNSSAGDLALAALGPRLWRRFGATDVLPTICAATAGAAYDAVYGDMLSADPFDVVHARCVVIWGANPTVANIHFPPLVQKARDAGARLIVVDPRRTAMAARADRHLALRPGTDVVLAYALADHMRREGLLDERFLAEHASGLDEFLDAAAAWPLARAADICGLTASDIAATAVDYATSRPAFLRMGWGLERNRNGGSSCRAVLSLPMLAGQFGVVGSGDEAI